MKTCSKCKTEKPFEDFGRDKNRRDGHFPQCKICKRAGDASSRNAPERRERAAQRSREHYATKKNMHVCASLTRKYGISLDEYDRMLEEQGNECAVCDRTPEDNGRRLAVDHNHSTGEVRGLLCDQCNVALGKLQDSPALLRNALAYLENRGHYGH